MFTITQQSQGHSQMVSVEAMLEAVNDKLLLLPAREVQPTGELEFPLPTQQ